MVSKRFTVGGAVEAPDNETFAGYRGIVVGFVQLRLNTEVSIRVEFPDHPWHRPGASWSFGADELVRCNERAATMNDHSSEH